ncbi:hypothetical protein NCCP2716_08840 [Sporosarcina sp. NCCP-2716]|uniref:sensor histidine kinase n=1 Tax=Sporosarcina sp. NCCP-2716 TaxID=2943679 RepID=UPI00203C49CC|nr:PAS domain-containing sensor histidine kinase [Sporosarcina sp. NCCP-2716]GKV68386.1 hypothetical protein NCCP2716_08840 [Sporosarcina sp. NCCP-2716]
MDGMKTPVLEFLLKNFCGTDTMADGSTAIFSYPDCRLLGHDNNFKETMHLLGMEADGPPGICPQLPPPIDELLKRRISARESEVGICNAAGTVTYWDLVMKRFAGDRGEEYTVVSFFDVTATATERQQLIRQNSSRQEAAAEDKEFLALRESVDDISLYYASFAYKSKAILFLNRFAFKAFTEEWPEIRTEADVIGKPFFNYYRAEDLDTLVRKLDEAVANRTSYLHKLEFTKDGITYHTKTIFQPVVNGQGEVEKIIALGIDISDEEFANRSMEKLLKDQEELFINTSHELKTPLTVISSGAQLIDLYVAKGSLDEHREEIRNVNKRTISNCYRLNRLVNNILDISKIESGLHELQTANYNIVTMIDRIVDSVTEYTKSEGVNILFDPEVEELIMAVDIAKFDRILLNLISNAIKFSLPGEEILVRLERKDARTVRISVRDEGIGIDPEHLETIFDKFVQVNRNLNRTAEGTGLGLPIAKSLAELHGGIIRAESEPGKGSTFTIELPTEINGTGTGQPALRNSDQYRAELIKYEFSDIYL